ncbi:MAG: Gfo/Idh/MocA family oxidoreductase [Enterocloster sp.]
MKVCFVGLGSIASRHIKNLHSLYGNSVIIDVVRSGLGNEISEDNMQYINQVFYGYSNVQTHYDAIFITNPTQMHYETLRDTHNLAKNFFIEKPVFLTGDEDLDKLRLKKDGIYYVACPLRYTNVINYLKKNIDFSSIFSIRCISSSYLPEWRAGTDYRQTYSAKKGLGGGVSIDLIHEWDYINYLIGFPKYVKRIS